MLEARGKMHVLPAGPEDSPTADTGTPPAVSREYLQFYDEVQYWRLHRAVVATLSQFRIAEVHITTDTCLWPWHVRKAALRVERDCARSFPPIEPYAAPGVRARRGRALAPARACLPRKCATTSSPTPGRAMCSARARHARAGEAPLRHRQRYPPFHYLDEVGVLTGFNVDLAEAICEAFEAECEVKVRRLGRNFTTLDRRRGRRGDRLVGIRARVARKADFSSCACTTPARFVALRAGTDGSRTFSPNAGRHEVGVAKGTRTTRLSQAVLPMRPSPRSTAPRTPPRL